MNIYEIKNHVLDEVIGKLEGMRWAGGYRDGSGDHYRPSQYWEHGGEIIEREGIGFAPSRGNWRAFTTGDVFAYGSSPLIAAMRAFVISRLGENIEVPE